MPFMTTHDGTALFWRDWGRGRPLLFLNSLGMGLQLWDYQVAAFAAQGFRCIGLDRRGHGRSDQPATGYDYDTFADDIAMLMSDLDLSQVTFIAHSMACGEVVRYLSRHGSDRVARIVLLAPTTPMLLEAEDNPRGLPRSAFESLWALWKQDYAKWVADAVAPFFVPETSPPMMRWTETLLTQQNSLPVALACSRAMVEADFRAEMRRIEIPALLIHGDRDRSAPLERTGQPSAELLPNCRLLVYPGAPHGLMYTHTERLHGDILRFIHET
jgi:non-heme chloroperoxidase